MEIAWIEALIDTVDIEDSVDAMGTVGFPNEDCGLFSRIAFLAEKEIFSAC